MASRRCAALVAGALFFASLQAAAAPSAAERDAARKLMDEGNARMKAGDPAKALESFQKANDLMHVPTTGLAVAKAHLAAGHLVEAREAALEVARTQKEPGEPGVFEKARKHARDLEAQVKPRIPSVKIHVKGGTATRITVDDLDVPLELAAEAVPLNPGKHVIAAKAVDGDGRTEFDLQESEKKDVDIALSSKSGADTKPAVTTTDAGPASPKKVLGFGNEEASANSPRRTPLAEGLVFGGFGAAIIGVGIGATTGIMTFGKASNIRPECANDICDPRAKTDLDSANTLSLVSTVAFGVGIAGIGAGILGLAIPRQHPGKHGALTLHPTANGVGGTF